jgi:hypothetical protein
MPFLRMTLHLSHIFLTLVLTFIRSPYRAHALREHAIKYHIAKNIYRFLDLICPFRTSPS